MKRTIQLTAALMLLGLSVSVYAGPTTRYVAQDGQTPDPGLQFTSWSNAASNIQEAVTAAAMGDTIHIGVGRYVAPTNGAVFNAVTNVVFLNQPVSLVGAGAQPSDVVIDGQGTNRAVFIQYDASAAHPFGFINLTVSNSWNHGILVDVINNGRKWTNWIERCVITHTAQGAGIYDNHYQNERTLVITNSILQHNAGGALVHRATFVPAGDVLPATVLVDSHVLNNLGSGVQSHRGTHRYERVRFIGNTNAAGTGGAAGIGRGQYTFYNCLFADNHASTWGGAFNKYNAGYAHVFNCTFINNTAVYGTAITHMDTSVVHIHNSIFYDHVRDWETWRRPHLVSHSRILDLAAFPDSGNTNADPQFVDAGVGNYRLRVNSPCINTGSNQTWMAGALDLDGNRRLDGVTGLVDMGAYEYQYGGTTILVRCGSDEPFGKCIRAEKQKTQRKDRLAVVADR